VDYRALAIRLRTENAVNELKAALTHKSFYAKEEETRGNSRYVFAGMFAFKGTVADVLSRYVPGAGTQLQHTLGNLFKNEQLEKIFAVYRLREFIRYGVEFEVNKHRHIFVYGLLGYLHTHADEEAQLAFIRRNFILPNMHLFMTSAQRNDLAAQCGMLAGIFFGERVKIERSRCTDNKWTTTVSVRKIVLASETSVSYRYSRNKALKNALIKLSEHFQTADEKQAGYAERKQRMDTITQQKLDATKAEKQAVYEKKQAEKAELRKQKREQRTQKALLAR